TRRVARGRKLLGQRLAKHGIELTAVLFPAMLAGIADAAVPPALVAATVQCVVQFVQGTAANAAAAVLANSALAAAAFPVVWSVKLKMLARAVVASLCAGVCALAYRTGEERPAPAADLPSKDPPPSSGNLRLAQAPSSPQRVDSFGDPLPLG